MCSQTLTQPSPNGRGQREGMAKKLRIGVIFGGRSGEHEVSIRSARSVIEAMDTSKYEVVPIAITKTGNWLAPALSAKLLPKGTQQRLSARELGSSKADVSIIGDPSRRGLARLESGARAEPVDVIFRLRHAGVRLWHGQSHHEGGVSGGLTSDLQAHLAPEIRIRRRAGKGPASPGQRDRLPRVRKTGQSGIICGGFESV